MTVTPALRRNISRRASRLPHIKRLLTAFLALTLAVPAAAQEVTVDVVIDAEGRSLVHQVIVPASIEDVWHAVSSAEGWQEWAVPLARPVPGTYDRIETSYDPSAAPGAPNTIEQQFSSHLPPHGVAYRTTRVPAGFPDGDVYLKVSSAFALKVLDKDRTEVTHVSTGFPDGDAGDRLIGFFREGNKQALEQLRERFVSGPRDWSKD